MKNETKKIKKHKSDKKSNKSVLCNFNTLHWHRFRPAVRPSQTLKNIIDKKENIYDIYSFFDLRILIVPLVSSNTCSTKGGLIP